ncbi:hypothetical protein, partial [Brucella oryzae]|uniref:hypothetical protein n=1 Tax=Brucella oryzae TaxID=335286 RepID=UPI001ABF93D2
VDPHPRGKLRDRSFRSLEFCSDGVRGLVAAVEILAIAPFALSVTIHTVICRDQTASSLIPTFAQRSYPGDANVGIKKITGNFMNLVDFSNLTFETGLISDGYQTSNSIH